MRELGRRFACICVRPLGVQNRAGYGKRRGPSCIKLGTSSPTPLHSIMELKSLVILYPNMTFHVILKVHPSV